jgi:3-oxoacyl-[acyl-carrier protein] reductase
MKRALVTGGSGAIGAAVCRELATQGMRLIVHAHRHGERALGLAAELDALGAKADVASFDLTDHAATLAAVEKLTEVDPIQVFVHCAGIYADAPMAGMSEAQWSSVIDVSLNGFFNTARPLLLPMLRTRWGRIVAVTSVAGVMGNRGQTNYAAAKAGLHGAVKSLAIEVASRGVTVNAVAPGIVASPMTDNVFGAADIERLVPMKRAGTPAEVAALIGFLCSEPAAYISGQVISVNGAMA